MMKNQFLKGIALATAAALTISTSASAVTTTVTSTVKQISFTNVSSTVQWLQITNGLNTQMTAMIGTASGCSLPNVSIDTAKLWHSQAQAALLTGKSLNFTYTDCGTAHILTRIDLVP